jgi:sugar phosphate isomerase/epimerase
MISYTALIEKFGDKGEKTGWTYIEIPSEIAQQLKPGHKKSFRVKGKLDKHSIKGVSLLPMGEGCFIMPLNADVRKAIKKKRGEKILVKIEEDPEEKKISEELIACLQDAPKAWKVFGAMPDSHQRYYSNWVESAKTQVTKDKRIVKVVKGLSMGMTFAEILKMEI